MKYLILSFFRFIIPGSVLIYKLDIISNHELLSRISGAPLRVSRPLPVLASHFGHYFSKHSLTLPHCFLSLPFVTAEPTQLSRKCPSVDAPCDTQSAFRSFLLYFATTFAVWKTTFAHFGPGVVMFQRYVSHRDIARQSGVPRSPQSHRCPDSIDPAR